MMETLSSLCVILQFGLLLSTFCLASTTIAVCEDQSETISCPDGIHVISARYGRFDRVTCVHSAMSLVGCGAVGVFEGIQSSCEGETSCELAPSNGNYGDPCPNTFKYLEVDYNCLPEQTTQPTTTTELTTTTTSTTTTTVTTTTSPPTTTTTSVATTTTERSTTMETTTDQQTTSPSTTTTTFIQTNASCTCICRYINDTTCEGGDLLCTLAKLKEQLSINKSSLSSFKRTKISAYDGRTSAKVIGISGVAVIMIVVILVVSPDVVQVLSFVFCSKSR